MLMLFDIEDLPRPLKSLVLNSMELRTTSAALEYLDVKLTPMLKRLCREVDTAREQYELYQDSLHRLLEEHEVRSVDDAAGLLIKLKLDAPEDMLDAIADRFVTAHACMRMHEDLEALRELVVGARLASRNLAMSRSMKYGVDRLWRLVRSFRRSFRRLRRQARRDILETAVNG